MNRFRGAGLDQVLAPVLAVFEAKEGFLGAEVAQNLDEPDLWVLITRWANVGSYRRALGGATRAVVVPVLSQSIDEPSAYAAPEAVGDNIPRAT